MKLEIGKTYKTRLGKTPYYIFARLKAENRFLGLDEKGTEVLDWSPDGTFRADDSDVCSMDLTEEAESPIDSEDLIQTVKDGDI